ncbi:hypothetical protein EUX98_g7316 [Antrodiella citrinella]|uniref:Transcription activator of gluconeogenesis ERT1 n=1 Tax=Antrodiella citrinella TaxID=2447956 RepID=A0A4S4MNS3_9APHY|nr:hypothetical protein EUX98_g7316 [Antrodiella citrinella]
MSTEQPQQTQSKSPNGQSEGQQPPSQAQAALAPTLAPYPPPPFNGHYPPPPGAYPGPFYTYAPVDGSHDPNGQGGMPSGPFLVAAYPPPPPGMMYAFSPPGHMGYPPFPPGMQPGSMPRPKRKQVKMACTNCAGACKRCDEARPCERCIKYGIADSCIDGVRKERKKGVKRGPYKRKSKNSGDNANGTGSQSGENGEAPSASTQPVYSPVPSEYSYPAPYYMPQPYGFPPPPPPPHEGHSSPNGSTSNDGHPPQQRPPPGDPPPYVPLAPSRCTRRTRPTPTRG